MIDRDGILVEVSYEEYLRAARAGDRVHPKYRPKPGEEQVPPPEVLPNPLPPPEVLPDPLPPAPPPEVLPNPLPPAEPPPILPPSVREFEDEGRAIGEYYGCATRVALLIALLIMLLVAAWFGLRDNDSSTIDDTSSSVSASPSSSPSSSESSASSAEDSTSSSGSTDSSSPPATTGLPPDPNDVPAGAFLVEGRSGDPIGHIAMDGQSRFLSLEAPGVGVGNAAIAAKSTIWPQSGEVLNFGAALDAPTNNGRYGINLFVGGTTYSAGCSMEKGQTACDFPGRGSGLVAGDSVTIIIGEAGNLEQTGNFTMRWWFVFQPD